MIDAALHPEKKCKRIHLHVSLEISNDDSAVIGRYFNPESYDEQPGNNSF